jgi:hypothetical protein
MLFVLKIKLREIIYFSVPSPLINPQKVLNKKCLNRVTKMHFILSVEESYFKNVLTSRGYDVTSILNVQTLKPGHRFIHLNNN